MSSHSHSTTNNHLDWVLSWRRSIGDCPKGHPQRAINSVAYHWKMTPDHRASSGNGDKHWRQAYHLKTHYRVRLQAQDSLEDHHSSHEILSNALLLQWVFPMMAQWLPCQLGHLRVCFDCEQHLQALEWQTYLLLTMVQEGRYPTLLKRHPTARDHPKQPLFSVYQAHQLT